MPLSVLLGFLLMPRSKSTQIELLEYSHLMGIDHVNKSDFCKQRKLLPATYIRQLNQEIVSGIYANLQPRLWHNHLLLAGDGTTYSLPNTVEIKKQYLQGRRTGRGEQALARGVVLKDVLNDVIVGANMEAYGNDEIRLLIQLLGQLPEDVSRLDPLVVLDRKYCAYTLLGKLTLMNINFMIRVKERFNKDVDDFIKSGRTSAEVVLHPASTTCKKLKRLYGKDAPEEFAVTLLRLSPEVVVMTSISDPDFDDSDSPDPYHLRWDDETTIGFMKNALQIEMFSGNLDNAIKQDFYCKVINYNLLAVMIRQAAELRHDFRDRQINRNVALGILKLNIPVLVSPKSPHLNIRLTKLLTEIGRFSTPVKPDRHNPRVFRKIKHSGKYITLQNYRRAI